MLPAHVTSSGRNAEQDAIQSDGVLTGVDNVSRAESIAKLLAEALFEQLQGTILTTVPATGDTEKLVT